MDGENTFKYFSLRARKARLGNFLNNFFIKIFFSLFCLAAGLDGLYLLYLKNPLGWFGLGFAVLIFIFLLYARLELKKVKNGVSNNITDILSHNVISHLDKDPTPLEIAKMVLKTRSGVFLANRFRLTPEKLELIASSLPENPEPIFKTAREIKDEIGAAQISGGFLALALILNYPDYEKFLGEMKLEKKDLIDGLTWYSYLYGLAKKTRRRDGGIGRDLAFGYISNLSRFGRNISLERGSYKTQIHQNQHREIIDKLIETFNSNGRQNIALIGAEGSGRTTIVEAFAEEILDADNKKVSNSLKYRQVFALDSGTLISAAQNRGEIEGLVSEILSEAYSAKNIIIYLDNAHLFFEEGTGSVDISNLLIPILESGKLRIILTMNEQKFLEISAKKPSLANALNKIMVKPAGLEDTMRVMEDKVPFFELQYGVIFEFLALKEAYRLSERYIHDLEMPGRALNLLEAAAKYPEGRFITAASVNKAIEETSGVKVGVIEEKSDREKLLNLETLLHERMIDQVSAVKTVSDALRRAAAGVRNEARPIGTFLFLGPTGVGKTELAKALSAVYFNKESEIVRIDLNEYVKAEDVGRLIATAEEDENSLTAKILKRPFSVVLLDEVEKASPEVLTTLLQLLDEGILRDSKNKEVSFRDAIIIMTSNAGADKIRETIQSGGELKKEELTDELIKSGTFKPEFLNRFDEICIFNPLGKAELREIAKLILKSTNKTLASQKIEVEVSEDGLDVLVEKGYDPVMGARPMRRIIQKTVENIVAKAVLSGDLSSGGKIVVKKEEILSSLE